MMVKLEMEMGTLATLIAGLYCFYNNIDTMAIPSEIYVEIAEKILPYLENWDYSELTFEDWLKYNLLILPKIMLDENDLEDFKNNDIYFERSNGNIVLVITAMMEQNNGRIEN